jgi:crossover junction endonuclease MUS81
MLLKIDHREPSCIKNNIKLKECVFENLQVGDFEFCKDNKTKIIIERKDLDDLCASIHDGRYDEQKRKLLLRSQKSEEHFPIAYLLEGNYKQHSQNKMILNIIHTLQFRDGFYVILSDNYKETIEIIDNIYRLIENDKFDNLSQDAVNRKYINSRKSSRTLSLDHNNWWLISLSQIKGIGSSKAKAIVEIYNSISDLLDAYNKCDSIDLQKTLLSNIKVGKKKLGNKASENIWKSIFNVQEKNKPLPILTKTSAKHDCLFLDD